MLRSHHVAFRFDEEVELKNSMLSNQDNYRNQPVFGKLILFLTIFEVRINALLPIHLLVLLRILLMYQLLIIFKALEFSERLLIRRITSKMPHERNSSLQSRFSHGSEGSSHHKLTYIFLNVLRGELSDEEMNFRSGDSVFQKNTHPDAFYIVTRGMVAVPSDKKGTWPLMVISGAGAITEARSLSSSNLLATMADEGRSTSVESFHKVGGIFGYCDFLLERYRTFDAVASQDFTVVAKFTKASMEKMKNENRPLFVIVQNLLLRASVMDLANCTCHN